MPLLTFSLCPEYLHPLPHALSFLLLEATPWSYDDPSSSLLALTRWCHYPPAVLSHLHGACREIMAHTPVMSAAWCLIWAVTGCASHPEAITAPTRGIMVQQSSVINQSSSVLVQQPRLCQPNSDPGFHQQFNACDFPHFVPGSTWRSKENHHLVLYLSPPNYQLPINVSLMTPLGTVRGPRYNEGLMRDLDKRLFWETRGASWEITHPKDSIIAFVQGHHFWDSENLLTQSLGPMCKSRMMELPERLKHPWKL